MSWITNPKIAYFILITNLKIGWMGLKKHEWSHRPMGQIRPMQVFDLLNLEVQYGWEKRPIHGLTGPTSPSGSGFKTLIATFKKRNIVL